MHKKHGLKKTCFFASLGMGAGSKISQKKKGSAGERVRGSIAWDEVRKRKGITSGREAYEREKAY